MAATNQVVSVKIGAVLTASFGTGFANAEKRVNAFSAVVTRANTKLEALRKTITAIGDSLKRMNAVVVTSESRLASLTTALGAQANAARSANTANAAMARGYQSAARARTAWNTAMAHMPPALPRSLTNPPPPFPRQPRGGGGGGNPAGSGRGTPLPRPGQVIGQAAVGLGMASLLSRSMGAVGSGMKNNALFEGDIQGVLNTADVDSSQLDATRKQLLAMTGRGRTNQKAEDLLGGLNVFASAGGIDFADQLAATEASGRTATASRAKVEDISKTSVSLMQNLKIKATDLGDALGMMTVAGKAGSFELKDMAQHFPSLGAMASTLGMTGREGVASLAAAMQAARKNTGTSGEAATNMENLFSKMTANETIERFQKQGIDWAGKVRTVLASGGKMNMLEEFVKTVQTATGGDAIKMKGLIPDMQANAALTALIQHQGAYQSIKASTAQGGRADVDKDFAKNAETAAGQMQSIENSMDRIGKAFGKAFEKMLPVIAPMVEKVAGIFESFAEMSPGAVVAITSVTAALGGVIGALALFGTGGVLAGVGSAFVTIFGGIATTVFGPIGLAIGAAALLVYKYWEPIKAFFTGFGEGISEALSPVWNTMKEVFTEFKPLWDMATDAVMSFLEPLGLTTDEFGQAMDAGRTFGKVVGTAIKWILKPITLVLEGLGKIAQMANMSSNASEGLRGNEAQKDEATLATADATRKKLIDQGIWKDAWGRDTVDINALRTKVNKGEISAKEMKALADAQNMEGNSSYNTAEDAMVPGLRLLAKVAANREATSSSTSKQEVNITVDARGAQPGVGDEIKRSLLEVSKGLSGDPKDQSRGAFQDSTSPGPL